VTLWIEKIQNAKSLEELENLRVDTLGKKGILTLEFAKMKDIPADEKKSFAENLNLQKEQITKALDSKKIELDFEALNKKLESEKIDVTKFNNELSCGAYHPVAETMNRITNYFLNLKKESPSLLYFCLIKSVVFRVIIPQIFFFGSSYYGKTYCETSPKAFGIK